MKKVFLTIMLFFIGIVGVNASEKIYNIDIDAYINEDGSANITEIWNVYTDKGTEFYKPMTEEVLDFKVSDETGKEYTYKNYWNLNGSLSDKAYSYGINTEDNVYELCWGKSTYGSHKYTISYKIENFIFNTEDAQAAYFKLINDSMKPYPENFTVDITSYYEFPDTLDVWGYGYEGLAYVNGGKISMTNDTYDFSSNSYVVLLAKFPLNTFTTTKTYNQFPTFNSIFEKAEEGSSTDYYEEDIFDIIVPIIGVIVNVAIWGAVAIVFMKNFKSQRNYDYGEAGKKIDMKEINNFRDIPCKKDLFRAYWFSDAYDLNKRKEDILGSLLLKWLFEDQIKLVTVPKKLFKKETTAIDLSKELISNNEFEKDMYSIMKIASKDNILETYELEKWCKNNYSRYFKWFDDVIDNKRDELVKEGLIYETETGKSIFKKTTYVLSPSIKNEAIELAGLKKYLKEFTLIHEKQAIEVKLWKEYLVYAQIFGIAKEVAKQFKDLYPELIETSNFDLTDIIIISNISTSSVSAASQARSAAQNYTSGGGGFSSFGGGGGSFGGGSGGGSR